MPHNASQHAITLENNSKRFGTFQNYFEHFKIFQNAFENPRMSIMPQNLQQLFKIQKNSSDYYWMSGNTSECTQTFSELFTILKNAPKCLQTTQNIRLIVITCCNFSEPMRKHRNNSDNSRMSVNALEPIGSFWELLKIHENASECLWRSHKKS